MPNSVPTEAKLAMWPPSSSSFLFARATITIAFQRIGSTGSTNLAVVGPSISEALIATAAGLFAAIPAVLAYNHFTTQVKGFASDMDDFSLEFLNIAERNFT